MTQTRTACWHIEQYIYTHACMKTINTHTQSRNMQSNWHMHTNTLMHRHTQQPSCWLQRPDVIMASCMLMISLLSSIFRSGTARVVLNCKMPKVERHIVCNAVGSVHLEKIQKEKKIPGSVWIANYVLCVCMRWLQTEQSDSGKWKSSSNCYCRGENGSISIDYILSI